MTIPLLTDQKESPGVTFAEPGASRGFSDVMAESGQIEGEYYRGNPQAILDIYRTAERSTRLTGNMVSETASREEAYDRRIAAVKKATGIELENPERGGYAIDARKAIRDEVRAGGLQPIDAKGGIPEYQKRLFDQKLAELQKDHPDLDFGPVDEEAKVLAKGAADAAAKAQSADVDPVSSFLASFAGGTVGSRRDPLFIGSMFAGPTSAVGRTAFARIASASLFSGLFNAGVSAVEQPTVQDWRSRIGMESGVIPAAHEVGMAFLLGMIPGAAVQGVKEGLATPLRRVLAGHPEPGDLEAIHAGLTPHAPREAAALASGAESVAADRATLTIPEPKGIEPQLHDDMLAAALKRADDPTEPSPEAVAAVKGIEAYHGTPEKFEAFDSKYIGSGEGAQAYSYGHYVAENKAVAEGYAKKLAAGKEPQLYRVSIKRKPEEFLDWELDMDAQPAGRKILAEMDPKFKERLEKYLDDNGQPELDLLTGQQFHRLLERWASEDEIPGVASNYENPHFRREASEFIQKLGVPGVRFLDNKSRAAGGGTRNYVVFDDKDLEITHRNNEARSRVEAEIEQRVTDAQPKSEREAIAAADEALDDIGRREGMAMLRESIAAGQSANRVGTTNVGFGSAAMKAYRETLAEAPKPASKDPIGKIPWVDDEGRPKLLSQKAAASVGERDDLFAMLVRSCK